MEMKYKIDLSHLGAHEKAEKTRQIIGLAVKVGGMRPSKWVGAEPYIFINSNGGPNDIIYGMDGDCFENVGLPEIAVDDFIDKYSKPIEKDEMKYKIDLSMLSDIEKARVSEQIINIAVNIGGISGERFMECVGKPYLYLNKNRRPIMQGITYSNDSGCFYNNGYPVITHQDFIAKYTNPTPTPRAIVGGTEVKGFADNAFIEFNSKTDMDCKIRLPTKYRAYIAAQIMDIIRSYDSKIYKSLKINFDLKFLFIKRYATQLTIASSNEVSSFHKSELREVTHEYFIESFKRVCTDDVVPECKSMMCRIAVSMLGGRNRCDAVRRIVELAAQVGGLSSNGYAYSNEPIVVLHPKHGIIYTRSPNSLGSELPFISYKEFIRKYSTNFDMATMTSGDLHDTAEDAESQFGGGMITPTVEINVKLSSAPNPGPLTSQEKMLAEDILGAMEKRKPRVLLLRPAIKGLYNHRAEALRMKEQIVLHNGSIKYATGVHMPYEKPCSMQHSKVKLKE